jgi:hypothetical protein
MRLHRRKCLRHPKNLPPQCSRDRERDFDSSSNRFSWSRSSRRWYGSRQGAARGGEDGLIIVRATGRSDVRVGGIHAHGCLAAAGPDGPL